mgnify:CR=1 FL=1
MIDINLLRKDSKEISKLLKERGFDLDIKKYDSLLAGDIPTGFPPLK